MLIEEIDLLLGVVLTVRENCWVGIRPAPPAPPLPKKGLYEGRAVVEKKTDIPSVGQLGQVGDDDLMDASS